MPHKDPEAHRVYNRTWYRRNRKTVIARVHERKKTAYAGRCVNCGGPTVGQSKNARPQYCAKPKCASAQRKPREERTVNEFRMIPLRDLTVDHDYQRMVDETRVGAIAAEYDPRLLDPLIVNHRNDKYAVVAGQHRFLALQLLEIDEAPCMVLPEGTTISEEAEIFVQQQRRQKRLTQFDIWKAEVFYGHEPTATINQMVVAAGFKIGWDHSSNSIAAVATLKRAHARLGWDGLANVLRLLHVFDGQEDGRNGGIVGGLTEILYRGKDAKGRPVDIARLEQVLHKVLAADLMRAAISAQRAEMGSWSRPLHVAKAIRVLYNKNLRSGRLVPLTDDGEE